MADEDVAGAHVHVDLVVTGDAPTTLRRGTDPFELQLCIPARLPVLASRGQRVHVTEEVHGPQHRAGHGNSCLAWLQSARRPFVPPALGTFVLNIKKQKRKQNVTP